MPVDQGAHKYRDLELHINENQEYECKRVRLNLEDAVAQQLPSPSSSTPPCCAWHSQQVRASDQRAFCYALSRIGESQINVAEPVL